MRVYSFETGGTGGYDVQSGIEHGGKRAISTAIGYNQLLTTNSVELLAEQGHELIRALAEKVAQASRPPRKTLEHKLAVLKQHGSACEVGARHLVEAREDQPIRRRAGRMTPWCSTSMSVRCCKPTSC